MTTTTDPDIRQPFSVLPPEDHKGRDADLPRLRERITALYAQTPTQVLAGLSAAVIFVILQGFGLIEAHFLYAAAIVTTQILRLLPWSLYQQAQTRPVGLQHGGQQARQHHWERLFLLTTVFAALAIGAAAAQALQTSDANSQILAVLMLAPPVALSLTLAPASARAAGLSIGLSLGLATILQMLFSTSPQFWFEALLLLMTALMLWVSIRLERQATALNETARQCATLEAHLASQAYIAKRTRETLHNVIGCVSPGVAIYDRNLHLIACNDGYRDLFPSNAETIREGISLVDVCRLFWQNHEPNQENRERQVLAFTNQFTADKAITEQELEFTLIDGRLIRFNAQRTEDKGWVVTCLDMTSGRKAATEALLHLSRHDGLTGLPNRAMIRRILERNVNQTSRVNGLVTVMLFNISNFRSINETFGTDIGDEVLLLVGKKLSAFCGKNDMVGRLGSDEFAVIATSLADLDAVRKQARALADQLKCQVEINGKKININVATGVTVYPHDLSGPDVLLRNAGVALTRARALDENGLVLFDQQMQRELLARAAMEIDIRANINSSQFSYHYQPQIDLKSQKLVGIEALLRWHHPERGWISPDKFIPVAELSRLIIPLTERMLPEICGQIEAWDARGLPPFKIAINLSPIHINEGSFPAFLRDLLARCKLPPERFEFEITETAMMTNSGPAIESLREIEAMGASLAVDDFGTGYASISYLRQFPVSKLKIDRSFVNELTDDTNARAIVAAVTRLGHSFGLKVVAEGVETEAQATALATMDCDMAQGYLFSRPLTGDDFSHWATSHYRTQGAPLPLPDGVAAE